MLSSSSQATLRKFAANLSQHSDTDLMIIGHTDNTGTDRVNNPLSYNRAASVRSFLAGQGVSSSRMKVEVRVATSLSLTTLPLLDVAKTAVSKSTSSPARRW